MVNRSEVSRLKEIIYQVDPGAFVSWQTFTKFWERVLKGINDRRVGMAKLKELENKARILRKHIIKMTCAAGSGHPGGSLSAADIVAALYFHELRLDPSRPDWPDRDRFVLSKGHAAPVLYAALAERGFFPVEELLNLRKLGSRLQGHPDMRKVPGVEMSTGSLGQGLSAANGMALAARLDQRLPGLCSPGGQGNPGRPDLGASCRRHYKLDNVTALDHRLSD